MRDIQAVIHAAELENLIKALMYTTGCRYVHVLADAYPILTDPCLGLSSDYPWAMAIATAATLATFTLEWVLHKTLHRRLSLKAEREDAKEPDHEAQLSGEAAVDPEKLEYRSHRLVAMKNTVMSYTFEIGIIFHSKSLAMLALCRCYLLCVAAICWLQQSIQLKLRICSMQLDSSSAFTLSNHLAFSAGIFIGITLGISSDADTVRALMIALFFHQGNEGLALGILFIKAGYSKVKYFVLAFAFVIVTPLGVAIGIGVSNNYNGLSKAALGTEGVFDAVSAGILIYNGLCDLILPTFSGDDVPTSWTLQVSGFGAMYLGAAIMALIGKWA